jgi:hypothetical protein
LALDLFTMSVYGCSAILAPWWDRWNRQTIDADVLHSCPKCRSGVAWNQDEGICSKCGTIVARTKLESPVRKIRWFRILTLLITVGGAQLAVSSACRLIFRPHDLALLPTEFWASTLLGTIVGAVYFFLVMGKKHSFRKTVEYRVWVPGA